MYRRMCLPVDRRMQLFYYYGRKKRIAHLYPEPKYDKIIEPFCGSAAYSLHGERWEKEVLLYDTNPVVIDIWKYLLQASVKDIQKLPDLKKGDDTRKIEWLSREERLLMGFAINPGSQRTCYLVSNYSRWSANKKYIVENIHKIKHWKVFLQDYTFSGNDKATWFIDPPYLKMGVHYVKTGLNYDKLKEWILERKGQIIACEGIDANYLPFEPIAEVVAIGKRISKEYVYIKER